MASIRVIPREGLSRNKREDPMKAEEVAEIRVELKGHKGFRNLKIREFVRTRSPRNRHSVR